MAYFDWNATAPLLDQARTAWLDASENSWANPSTSYRVGVQSRLSLEEARESLAGLTGFRPDQVVFTSGATEANNALIREAARRLSGDSRIWLAAIEHPSVTASARAYWGDQKIRWLKVDANGQIDLDAFRKALQAERPGLVSVMAANNETGVLQPWTAILAECRNTGVAFHCDAVQAFGKTSETNWAACSAITLSGHKLGAPKGIGCLVVNDEWKGLRIQAGGSQEMDMRAGTENVPGAVAMAAAAQSRKPFAAEVSSEGRDHFESRLIEAWGEAVTIHGMGSKRLWNTCSVALPEFRSERWIAQLDRLGFQLSSGSACSTGKAGPSPVLQAMGTSDDQIRRTVRISSGWETSADEWDQLLDALMEAEQVLRRSGPSQGPGQVIQI